MFVILIIASLTTFCFKHKTRYLHIESYQSSAYVDVIGEIYFKDYPNTKTITDTASIKKIVDYLNNIPLVSVYGYFDKSKQEFIVPELTKNKKNSSTQDDERGGCLIFYNYDRIEIGRIKFYNEKYIEGLNYNAYKVKNDETFIISELEVLDLK